MQAAGVSDENNQIFKRVCELIATEDFNIGQMTFFQRNCHAFSDEDENAHATKNIHEEYIQLIDSAIEAQLLQYHSEEQI